MVDIPELADNATRAEIAAWFECLQKQAADIYAAALAKEKAAKKRKQHRALSAHKD